METNVNIVNTVNDIPFDSSLEALRVLSLEYSLCVTGPSLKILTTTTTTASSSTSSGISSTSISIGSTTNGKTSSSTKSNNKLLLDLCPYITIFARVSPAQKEIIVIALNDGGERELYV